MVKHETFIPLFDSPLPITFVYRWISSQKRKVYIFVGKESMFASSIKELMNQAENHKSYWPDELQKYTRKKERPSEDIAFIFATIWPDDNVIYGLTKIVRYIQHVEKKSNISSILPFAWTQKGLLRFDWSALGLDIDIKTIDPWKNTLPIIEKQPSYHTYQQIEENEIQLILYDDIQSLPKQQLFMYFPDAKETKQLASFTFIERTEEYLTQSWTAKIPNIENILLKMKTVVFEGYIDIQDGRQSLAHIFENIHATKDTPLIQWVDDITRVMYKLYKKHSISVSEFNSWVNRYNISKVPSVIMYDVKKKLNTYIKTQLYENGNIIVTYTIDNTDKDFQSLEVIHDHLNSIWNRIENVLEKPANVINTKLIDIGYDIQLQINILGFPEEQLIQRIHEAYWKAIPLFYIMRSSDVRNVQVICKRSSNLIREFSIPQMIQSFLDYGVYITDIRQYLVSFGYTKKEVEDALDIIEFAQKENNNIRPQINLDKDIIMALLFTYKNDGIMNINIRHAPSIEEAKRSIRWMVSVIFMSIQAIKDEFEKLEVLSVEPEIVSEKEKEKEEQKKIQSSKSTSSVISNNSKASSEMYRYNSDSTSSEIDGGAGDHYLLERLQKADKIIFENKKESYAKGCQKERQPLWMTKEEWETNKNKVDNSILYRNNYYSCPSIWCKKAGIAITVKELEENNGKCPKTNETPLILWDKPKKRFVGFNKNIIVEDNKNIYSPCCFTANNLEKDIESGKYYDDLTVYRNTGEPIQLKPEERTKTKKKAMNKTYLFQLKEPVPVKEDEKESDERYGSVPMALYKLFFPQYAEQPTNISTLPTIVRHGISTKTDTLMASIAYAMGYKDKNEFIEDLIEPPSKKLTQLRLDPLTFITLEGGAVLAAFMSDGTPQISYANWRIWIDQYPDYKKLFMLNKEHEKTDMRILREIKIYEAYLKFIHHLQSDDEKNTRILYNLLARFNVLLMIWERDQTDMIKLSCPYFIDYERLKELTNTYQHRSVMLLYHKTYKTSYYEPLEIRASNKEPVKEILLEEYPLVENISQKCPISYQIDDIDVIESIRAMIYWTINYFEINWKQYTPKMIVLSADLHIEGIITFGNIWIQLQRPTIEILSKLIEMIKSIEPYAYHKLDCMIQYHEDLDIDAYVKSQKIANPIEYEIWKNKCEEIGFRIQDTVPPPAPVVPIVSIMSYTYQDEFDNMDEELTKNRDVQLKIAKYLLYRYEDRVKEHITKPRKEFIEIMMDLVLKDLYRKESETITKKIRDEVKTTIEEMPLTFGKESLQKWIYTITLDPYHFYDSQVHSSMDGDHNWIFSQLAVEEGLEKDIITPKAAITPKQYSIPTIDQVQQVVASDKEEQKEQKEQKEAGLLPFMAQKEQIKIEEMPVKWKDFMTLLRTKEYTQEMIPDLFKWIARQIHSPLRWSDILRVKFVQIANYRQLSEALFKKVFESLIHDDVSFQKALKVAFHQKASMTEGALIQYIWNEKDRLYDILQQIFEMHPTPLWPSDIDFRMLAQLLDIFVLMIFKKPYSMEEEKVKKTKLENLRLSSVLYSNSGTTMDRPLLMIYREKEAKKSKEYSNVYHLIIDEKHVFYHTSASDAPQRIQEIVQAHRNSKRE